MSIGHAPLFSTNFMVYKCRKCYNPSCVRGSKFDWTIFYARTIDLSKVLHSHYLKIWGALRRSRFTNLNDSFVVSGSHTINAMNDDPTSKPATGCVVDHGPDILLHLELSGEGDSEVCPFRSAPHQHLLCFCQCKLFFCSIF